MSRASIPPISSSLLGSNALREMASQISDLRSMDAVGNGIMERGAAGMVYAPPPPLAHDRFEYGILVNEGPDGQDDFEDARYWVQLIGFKQQASATAGDTANGFPVLSDGYWVSAINIREMKAKKHALNTVDPLEKWADELPDDAVIVRLTRTSTVKLGSEKGQDGNEVYTFEPVTTDEGFYAKITASQVIDSATKKASWFYSLAEVDPNGWLADGSSVALSNGRTIALRGFSIWEANNSGTGIGLMGCGITVTSAQFAAGQKLGPVPTGTVVWVHSITVDCNGDVRWNFTGMNTPPECS